MKIHILIVDDEASMEKLIRRIFRQEEDSGIYSFSYRATADEAYQLLINENNIDIVLQDIKMPGTMDGLELLEKINLINPLIKFIMVSAFSDFKRARSAIQHHAFDFLEKPIDQDDLKFVVKRAADYVSQSKKILRLQNQLNIMDSYVKNDLIDVFKYQSVKTAVKETHKETLTLVFASIQDYKIEDREPNAVFQLLNPYFHEITKAVSMYNGFIDKYFSDTAIAIFTGNGHVENGVKAAIKIQEQINSINSLNHSDQDIPARARVCLSSGEVISGNISSMNAFSFFQTMIGDTFALCCHLSKIASAGDILFARTGYTEFILKDYSCRALQTISLKGKPKMYDIYNIKI